MLIFFNLFLAAINTICFVFFTLPQTPTRGGKIAGFINGLAAGFCLSTAFSALLLH